MKKGETVVILEAMKTEISLKAPRDAVVEGSVGSVKRVNWWARGRCWLGSKPEAEAEEK